MLRPLGPPPATPAAGLSPSTGGTRQRKGSPSACWPVQVNPDMNPDTRPRPRPLGALATTGRGFLVLACCWRRPRAHRQRASPAPAPRGWRPRVWPCCPRLGPGRARAPDHRAKHDLPVAAPRRRVRARGTAPSAAAAAPPRQKRDRFPRPAGDGCPAASTGGGPGHAANPRAPLKAGRAAGATELSVLEFPASRGRPRPAEVDPASMRMESSD